MSRSIEKLFRAPYGVPNALQTVAEGLWITDQITDRVALVEIAAPSEYGVTRQAPAQARRLAPGREGRQNQGRLQSRD